MLLTVHLCVKGEHSVAVTRFFITNSFPIERQLVNCLCFLMSHFKQQK